MKAALLRLCRRLRIASLRTRVAQLRCAAAQVVCDSPSEALYQARLLAMASVARLELAVLEQQQ